MNNKFEIKIDGNQYGLVDVKKWADELEVKPMELVEKMQDWDAKQWALFAYMDFDAYYIDDITNLDIDIYDVEIGSVEVSVLTDDEADDRWEEELDSYLEACVYPEIPEWIRNYFDDEAWKRDARYDGRGHSISRYDGNENVFRIEFDDGTETWIYIYRQY